MSVKEHKRGAFATKSRSPPAHPIRFREEILKAQEANDLLQVAKAIEYHRLRSMRRLEETA
jgi:hypothetical protein